VGAGTARRSTGSIVGTVGAAFPLLVGPSGSRPALGAL